MRFASEEGDEFGFVAVESSKHLFESFAVGDLVEVGREEGSAAFADVIDLSCNHFSQFWNRGGNEDVFVEDGVIEI